METDFCFVRADLLQGIYYITKFETLKGQSTQSFCKDSTKEMECGKWIKPKLSSNCLYVALLWCHLSHCFQWRVTSFHEELSVTTHLDGVEPFPYGLVPSAAVPFYTGMLH